MSKVQQSVAKNSREASAWAMDLIRGDDLGAEKVMGFSLPRSENHDVS